MTGICETFLASCSCCGVWQNPIEDVFSSSSSSSTSSSNDETLKRTKFGFLPKTLNGRMLLFTLGKNKLLLGVILKDAIVVKAFQQTSDSSLVANQFFNQARPLSFLLNNASVMLAKYTRQVVLPS